MAGAFRLPASVVRRALAGGAQATAGALGPYATTADSCRCKDREYRNRTCKHMRAYRVLFCLKEGTGDGDEGAPAGGGDQ